MNNDGIEGLSDNDRIEYRHAYDMLMKILHKSSSVEKEDKICKLGLTWILAYHCQRCNYIWIPRDLDAYLDLTKKSPKEYMLDREPPKCCARCKSRSWRTMPETQRFNLAKENADDRVWELTNPKEAKLLDKMTKSIKRKLAYRNKKSLQTGL